MERNLNFLVTSTKGINMPTGQLPSPVQESKTANLAEYRARKRGVA